MGATSRCSGILMSQAPAVGCNRWNGTQPARPFIDPIVAIVLLAVSDRIARETGNGRIGKVRQSEKVSYVVSMSIRKTENARAFGGAATRVSDRLCMEEQVLSSFGWGEVKLARNLLEKIGVPPRAAAMRPWFSEVRPGAGLEGAPAAAEPALITASWERASFF